MVLYINMYVYLLIVLIIFISTSSLIGMKGELEGLVAVVASWLSGYGGYSWTP